MALNPDSFKKLAIPLQAAGYEPIPIRFKHKAPLDKGWSSMPITRESVIRRAQTISEMEGVGVRCGTGALAVYAADFDIYEADVSKAVSESFFARFGRGPIRIGQEPKLLSVYTGQPGQVKLKSAWSDPSTHRVHAVEILGAGQQFVAFGRHATTGQPYRWPEVRLDGIETWELPVLDLSQVAHWMETELPLLMPEGWTQDSVSAEPRAEVDAFELYKAPLADWPLDRVVEELLPELDPDMGYEEWVRVGMALHHQGEGGDEWLDAYDEWSSGGETYKPDECAAKWASFGTLGKVTVTLGSLLFQAGIGPEPLKVEYVIPLKDRLLASINGAKTEIELCGEVCLEIRRYYRSLNGAALSILAKAIKDRHAALGIGSITMADARELMAPPRHELTPHAGVPGWAQEYVYVTQRSAIFRYDSNEWLTKDAFEFKHNADAGFDENGLQLSAYNLLKNNRALTKVEQAAYMPQLPATFELGGTSYVNTYMPSSVPPSKPEAEWTEADRAAVACANDHIMRICDGRQEVYQALMDWLAHIVQLPGVKITYTFLIIGGEGVGKTWIGQMMATAMGQPNVRVVSGQEVLNPTFNGWAEGAALIIVEEVRVHGHKEDAWDNLKAPLTNNTIVIVRKGKDGYTVPNTGNYLLLSNHPDAVPVTLGSRRVGVIQTPFGGDETAEQLHEMAVGAGYESSSAYFDALFNAIEKHPEAIRGWLMGWRISDAFNPTGRAPVTEERDSMALNNISEDEQDVRDALEAGGVGVCREVVSPKYMHTLLQFNFNNNSISPEKIAYFLRKMGYSKYPKQVWFEGAQLRVWLKNVPKKMAKTVIQGREKPVWILEKLEETKSKNREDDFLK